MSGVVAAILAAGASRRLGRPKQLVSYRGGPLVRHVVDVLRTTVAAELGVVVGAVDLSSVLEATIMIPNPDWEEGIASSVRAAVRWARQVDASSLVLATVDQPLIDRAHVDALVVAWREGAPAVGSAYEGVLGIPAVFDASLFDRLAELGGDRGAGGLLRALPDAAALPWPAGAIDIDTEADLLRLARQG